MRDLKTLAGLAGSGMLEHNVEGFLCLSLSLRRTGGLTEKSTPKTSTASSTLLDDDDDMSPGDAMDI